MYNFGVNAGLSATAVLNGYDRLVNVLVGMIILPLLFMIGFLAIQSDFAKVKPISSGNNSYMLVSDNNSIGSINQKQDIKLSEYSGGSGIGDICGKRMILFPMIPDEMFVGYSSKINSDKRKGITFDSTIYLSIEMVDKAPELIWMVYPNLVKTGS
ncbi:MAG: hypothetical protein GY865_16760, partial [candidate division Zixibacteria bacterium]|nr:hypothetical protein [candidate division Zixibacteria bacterium]